MDNPSDPIQDADPFEVLQVHRKANPLVVMKAFRVLAAMYHPDNRQTGDRVQFERVVEAYRLLSDPNQRAVYDRMDDGQPGAAAGGQERIVAPERRRRTGTDERRLRMLILSTLYNTRRSSLSRPGLSLRVLAELTDSELDETQFSLWYLRGKKFIEIGDNDEVAITVTGVDYVEEHGGESEELLSLPEARGLLKEASDVADSGVGGTA
jgi:curved DNA-binding protein